MLASISVGNYGGNDEFAGQLVDARDPGAPP